MKGLCHLPGMTPLVPLKEDMNVTDREDRFE
jgi:hypothetical protein